MQWKGKKGRKQAILGTVVALVLGAAAAFAFFSSTGSGTGTALTGGSAKAVTVSQVGAGYDSLITSSSPNPYIQDQCFQCEQISQLGNDITLANAGSQQLVSVVVAFRNWNGNSITGLPITLSINNTIAGPISDTENANFPPALTAGSNPSVTDVTFNFQSQNAIVQREFVYGITFDPSFDSGAASGLNVALSSSANNLSIGTDTHPGTLYVKSSVAAGSPLGNDFPGCTVAGTGFASVNTACGPASLQNPGAYGTPAQVAAGNADIPAVQVNVVGGVVPPLYPGGPAAPVDFAITNPNSFSVHVASVTTSVTGFDSNPQSDTTLEPCATSMYPITGSPNNVNTTVPSGTTVFSPSHTFISMKDDGNNQDNCQGLGVKLGFTSN